MVYIGDRRGINSLNKKLHGFLNCTVDVCTVDNSMTLTFCLYKTVVEREWTVETEENNVIRFCTTILNVVGL